MSRFQQINLRIEKAVVKCYKMIESCVVSGYKKIEDGVVGNYRKVEERIIQAFFQREGESLAETRERLNTKVMRKA